MPPISRQMLHARRLGFTHPDQERYLEFEAPLPEDMGNTVLALKLLDLQNQANKELDMNKKGTIMSMS